MEYRLLEKTELWIKPVKFDGADLGACARAAAQALDLNFDEIMVTDVVENVLTLDVLTPTIRAEKIIARKAALLSALRKVKGINVLHETDVHSDGILGLISIDEKTGQKVIERSRAMGAQIAEKIRKRCILFSTGKEVLSGQIIDTNTPFLTGLLEDEGYQVTIGATLEDDVNTIIRAFRAAAEDGYGLVITTGGIGAEKKDQTLEALHRVDLNASMPYILKFQKGQGRHYREGVRIGVGNFAQTLIVCLPGPHDEVRLAWPVLKKGMRAGWDKEVLAEGLVNVLRDKFLARSGEHQVSFEDNIVEVRHDFK